MRHYYHFSFRTDILFITDFTYDSKEIRVYAQEQYWPPEDFQRLLSTKLKALVATGKLIKVSLMLSIYKKYTLSWVLF